MATDRVGNAPANVATFCVVIAAAAAITGYLLAGVALAIGGAVFGVLVILYAEWTVRSEARANGNGKRR
jgi:hypothetical protein